MKRIIIVGAGPAGITSAYELSKNKDYEVVVLEASDEIGGISKTANVQGNRMDMGGHRFFSKNEKVMNWWFELMPLQSSLPIDDKELGRNYGIAQNGADPEDVDDVMLIRNRVSRIYYKHKWFDYPVKLNWNTIKNMGFITTIKCGIGYVWAMLFKKPEDNLENFYINKFGRPLYSMFFEGYTEKLWGRHPSEISADWGAQRVKGLSITAILKDVLGKLFHVKNRKVETSLIEKFYYPKFGPGQLWEKALGQAKNQGALIEFNCEVVGIEVKHGKACGVYALKDGERHYFPCDVLISTMPFKDLAKAVSDVDKNAIDADVERVAINLPYRDFITCGLLVDKLAVKNTTSIPTYNDNIPDCWVYIQDTGVKMGRIQIFNNWSPYMVKDFKNKIWIGTEYFCNEGDDMWNMSDEKFTQLAIDELTKIGVINDSVNIELSHVEHVKKAYPAYFDTYDEIYKVQNWVDDISNLYCVGRSGQHHYNNMDHSMLTAFMAVDIINGQSGVKKSDLWSVNAEKEYHEEK